jgi:hypothetical protein
VALAFVAPGILFAHCVSEIAEQHINQRLKDHGDTLGKTEY